MILKKIMILIKNLVNCLVFGTMCKSVCGTIKAMAAMRGLQQLRLNWMEMNGSSMERRPGSLMATRLKPPW